MENSNLIEQLRGLAEQINAIRDRAFSEYTHAVSMVVTGRITDAKTIERIADGLSDFCDEERFIELYRQLNRHIFYTYPELVGEHVALHKMLWATNKDLPTDETAVRENVSEGGEEDYPSHGTSHEIQ